MYIRKINNRNEYIIRKIYIFRGEQKKKGKFHCQFFYCYVFLRRNLFVNDLNLLPIFDDVPDGS